MSLMRQCDVLLLYGWVRSTYAALRNLHSHGLRVAVADSNRLGMCQLSRYSQKFCRYHPPFADRRLFIEDINHILERTGARVLIPSHDETEIIAGHLDELPSAVSVPIPTHEMLTVANNKGECQQRALQAGLPVPATLVWESIPELASALKTAPTALVVKLRRGNSAKGVFYASSHEEAIDLVQRCVKTYSLSASRYPLVQERVRGEGWGVSCLFWHGDCIASFTHRRLREKTATGGTSTLREHQPNPFLERMAIALLSSLRWHGLAMVEFKYDPATGKAYFMEINPRLWGSIHLAISAGAEFPYLLFLCATQGPEAARTYASAHITRYPWKARWFLGDCIVTAQLLRDGEVLSAFRNLLPSGADTCDDIDVADIGAFVGELGYYAWRFATTRNMNPAEEGMLG